ncbi:MAG TPA: GMC family oxidoreductase, partial [Bryobacteraceae bacterium]|nr:GMC family oxidoreductase [Bryobacteraceae bacterium]
SMQRLKPVDVVIVGGGWVGLAMAKEIAGSTPLSVVVLERGPARRLKDYAAGMDEVDYTLRFRMMQNLAEETTTHRHSTRQTAVPIRQYGSFNPGTGVGGAGEHWGGLSYRYLPDQFRLATVLREKHGNANLPEDLAVEDWGVTYDELEPYYWRAEQMMGIGGKAGNLRGQIVEGGNPFEGPRSYEFPNPPHPQTYLVSLFTKTARELGYHPFPTPAATLSQTYRNPDGITRSGCAYCGYCLRYGCMIGAKAQPTNTLLPLLAKRKNFTLRTGCSVRRVLHREGKAAGVTYVGEAGAEVEQPARVVILASWTLNNNRLLMMSRIGEPYDPSTGKGTLGRNLTHQVSHATPIFLDRPLNGFMGAGGLGATIADFDGDIGLDSSFGILRGGHIRIASGGEAPIASFGRIPPGEADANWGSAWKKAALKWWDRSASITSEAEHLAYRQNYIDLDPTYTDKFGDPLARLTLDWTDHERRQAAMTAKVQESIAKAMGAKVGNPARRVGAHYSVVEYQSSHVSGGAIAGASPETSVVNPWMQHWRVPNLWVIGASAFPQNSSGNPTMTILAMAYRAADAIVNRYLKHPGALA